MIMSGDATQAMEDAHLAKGQLTFEALLAAACALSLLLIAAAAISKMHEAQNYAFERGIVAKEMDAIANYADEICILGDGNARAVPLAPVRLLLENEGDRMLVASLGEWKIKKAIICKARVEAEVPFSQEAYLWHEREGEEPVVVISSTQKFE